MKRFLKSTFILLALLAFTTLPGAGQNTETAHKQAEELLIKARTAIGGEEKIKAVKSLSLAGNFRRDSMLGELDGEIEFDFLFPGKFISTDRLNLPIGTITTVSVMDGETAWQKTSSSSERIKFAGYTQKEIDDRKLLFPVFAARLTLGLLLRSPGWSSLEFTYAGEAETEGNSVNLIDVRGADGFSARLFLDKTTNRLTMMSYMKKMTDNKTPITNQTAQAQSGNFNTVPNITAIKPGEVLMRFADYRTIDGIQFPHSIEFQSGEGNNEKWTLTKIQLDIALAPDIFKEKI